jgi:putative thioredoxin
LKDVRDKCALRGRLTDFIPADLTPMIDVTVENFEAEVILASNELPVLVDFWAPWCGPCKSLGPVLEKLEVEYAGRFKLVKINSDDEQQLSQAFGIRSIPTCVLMKDGKPADGFMGALPEGKVREFLDKHLPGADELIAEEDVNAAEALLAEGNADAALEKLQEALAVNPANDDARYEYVKLLMAVGELDKAQVALAPALAQIPLQLRFEALHHWGQALQFAHTDERAQWQMSQFDALIEKNKRDFDTRLAKARLLMAAAEWTAAMDELLEIVMRDKTWSDQVARKNIVAILELLTPPKPKGEQAVPGKSAGGIELTGKAAALDDPQAELLSRYRRKLSMALN